MTINDCDALVFLFVFGASYVPEIYTSQTVLIKKSSLDKIIEILSS